MRRRPRHRSSSAGTCTATGPALAGTAGGRSAAPGLPRSTRSGHRAPTRKEPNVTAIAPPSMDEFESLSVDVQETHVHLRRAGDGPPLLLLHGFPQTHLMWRHVAPRLARRFTVVCA